MIKLLRLILIFIISGNNAQSAEAWDYKINGEDVWFKYSQFCQGKFQSPINIDSTSTEYNSNLAPFIFNNYNTNQNWTMLFNGETLKVSPISSTKMTVQGSDLNTTATLLQLHFHWGQNDYQGSEHRIDNKKYPLEMHLVHQIDSRLVVLGFLFLISDTDNPNLASLINATSLVNSTNPTTIFASNIQNIIKGIKLTNYYRYSGGLTAPPCTEIVTWNVFSDPISISSKQLQAFRATGLHFNFREPQMLNCRKVYSSFQVAYTLTCPAKSSSSILQYSFIFLSFLSISGIFFQ